MELMIEQIGNGGGLDVDKINTSFVIHIDNKPNILIDCGFNVPKKLKELDYIKDIEYVFITHKHMDHIGGLETLIYLRYFIYGKITNVIMDSKVYEDIGEKFFNHFNSVKDNNKIKYEHMVNFNVMELPTKIYKESGIGLDNGINIYGIHGQHGDVTNVGFILNIDKHYIMFTGDTNATLNIKNTIKHIVCDKNNQLIVFHDYSNWDNPVENIHCCKSEFTIYKDLINKYQDNLTFYKVHDGSDRLITHIINLPKYLSK